MRQTLGGVCFFFFGGGEGLVMVYVLVSVFFNDNEGDCDKSPVVEMGSDEGRWCFKENNTHLSLVYGVLIPATLHLLHPGKLKKNPKK